MKIRIKGNSLRYRLTRSEVSQLWSEGYLEERTAFGNKALVYAIETAVDDKLSADFIVDKIVLRMPRSMVEKLNHTDSVGFEDRTGPVSLLVEKDFACIDNVGEDQSDNYPNPLMACK